MGCLENGKPGSAPIDPQLTKNIVEYLLLLFGQTIQYKHLTTTAVLPVLQDMERIYNFHRNGQNWKEKYINCDI